MNKKMFEFEGTIANKLSSLGLALLIIAMVLGMYAKIYLGIMNFNQYLLILGLLLFFPYRRLQSISEFDGQFMGVLFFFLLVFLYMFMSPNTANSDYLSNSMIFILIFAIGFTHCYEDISISNVIKLIWIFSLLCVIGAISVIQSGLDILYNSHDIVMSGDERIYDDLTAAQGGIMNVYCALYLFTRRHNKWELLLLSLGVVLSIYSILLTQKRTPFIVIIFVIFYYLYSKNQLRTFLNPRYLLLAALLFFALVFGFSNFLELFDNVQERVFSGLDDLLFGVDSYDAHNSTAIRYYTRLEAFERIDNFTFGEFLLGAGYKTKYLDMPILQSYQDMGILGFCFFTYFQLILPMKILFHPKQMSDELMWASFMVCYGMLGCLTTGHPYIINKWLPILVLSMIYIGDQKYSDYTYNIYERID